MGRRKWVAITLEEIPDRQVVAFVDALGLEDAPGSRVLRSASEQVAVILPLELLRAVRGIDVETDLAVAKVASIALLLASAVSLSARDEIGELLERNELLAVPEDLRTTLPQDLSVVGRLEQDVDKALPRTFVVVRRNAEDHDTLLRGAPTGLGEVPGHLEGREAWFKKRH